MRKTVLLAGAAALLPTICSVPLAAKASGPANTHFAPPSSDMILTRIVWRELADGGSIMVRRSYAVRFVPEESGYRLDGHLIDATVDAPPELAPLAELERTRPDNSLFPIRLDGQGKVLSDGVAPIAETRQAAASIAQGVLAKAPMRPTDRAEALKQAKVLGTDNGVYGHVPLDLFQPQPGERHERRPVALPDGQTGAVEIAIKVADVQSGGLAGSVERTVTTELAGTRRVSREVWSIKQR